MDMIERFAQFRKRTPEQQRSVLWAGLCDARRSNGGRQDVDKAGPEQPTVSYEDDNPTIDKTTSGETLSLEDTVAIGALSDEALESVASGLGVPRGDTPGKLREAAYCYLADTASNEANPFVT